MRGGDVIGGGNDIEEDVAVEYVFSGDLAIFGVEYSLPVIGLGMGYAEVF